MRKEIDPMTTFDDVVRVELAKRGIALLPDGSLALEPSFEGAGPSQEQIEHYNEVRRLGEARSEVELLWLKDLRHNLNRVLAADSTDPNAVATVFFLRLHGWLWNYPKHHAFELRTVKERLPGIGSTLAFMSAILEAVEAIRVTFSEDELMYIEYKRDIEGHIHASKYDPQWNKKKGTVEDKITIGLTGRTYNRRDASKRIADVMRGYGMDATRIALDFARRIEPSVRGLEAAVYASRLPQPD
jgi:hypothetical protein